MNRGQRWAAALCVSVLTACGESTPPAPPSGDIRGDTSSQIVTSDITSPGESPVPTTGPTTKKPKPPAPPNPARIYLPDLNGRKWPEVWSTWQTGSPDCRPLESCIKFTFVANGVKVPRSKLGPDCVFNGRSPAPTSADLKYGKGDSVTVALTCGTQSTETASPTSSTR
jgi:hypothetical protein